MNFYLLKWRQGYHTFDDVFDFQQVKSEHFLPAIEKSFLLALEQIASIENSQASPTFVNTIEALEMAVEDFEWVLGIYSCLFHAEADREFRHLAEKIFPKSAELNSRIFLSEKLFSKVRTIWDQKDKFNLNKEERKLLEKTYRTFVRGGALLSSAQKERIRHIDQKLSALSPQFGTHVLEATNEYALVITNSDDLKGLPNFVIEAAHEEARKRGYTSESTWVITLHAPSYVPFMQYSERRHLRETLWRAYNQRCLEGAYDNRPLIKEILSLRQERAQILGYRNHAAYILEDRMAKTSENVMNFLEQLLEKYAPMAQKDLSELKELAQKMDGIDDLMPWDVSYYSEKLKKAKYDFDEEDLRPYFSLENVIQGVFTHAKKLYDLDFIERTDIPKYHPDVRTYEIRRRGEYLAMFYGDFFSRPTKQSGAWMAVLREQGLWNYRLRRPHVMNVCNFAPPTQSRPSLLSFSQVLTLFHEFGHALHGMLSQCRYRSLAGTNVKWDFVELPSQIMENWVYEKESLDLFARHYQTQEPIPVELLNKLRAAKYFQSGLMGLRQLNFSFLDMYWHLTPVEEFDDLMAMEHRFTERTRLFPPIANSAISVVFNHIFAGGYSAGYYSYKWAEVLDADAFELFLEKGIFNQQIAQKFYEHILSQGAQEEPEVLYERFRGRPPKIEALLRREGILQNSLIQQ